MMSAVERAAYMDDTALTQKEKELSLRVVCTEDNEIVYEGPKDWAVIATEWSIHCREHNARGAEP